MFSQPPTANFESVKTLLTIVVSMGPEGNGFVVHIGENGMRFYTSLTITGNSLFEATCEGPGHLPFTYILQHRVPHWLHFSGGSLRYVYQVVSV